MRKRYKVVLCGLAACLVGLILAELAARVLFGFSMDEPIVFHDKDAEYLLVPGRHVDGYFVNELSMRGEPVPPVKPEGEFRVLVLGDSVTEGGVDEPLSALATTLAAQQLNGAGDGRTYRILNASTGSWSAVNQLGYIKKFGLVEADAVILVWNSADATDGFGSPNAPTSKPRIGLERAARNVQTRLMSMRKRGVVFGEPGGLFAEANAAALHGIIDRTEEAGIPFVAIWHPERTEAEGEYRAEQSATIRDVLDDRGIENTPSAPRIRASIAAGGEPYADFIHLSDEGQRLLAELLTETIARLAAGVNAGGEGDAEESAEPAARP